MDAISGVWKRNYSRFETLRNLGMWTSESGKFLLAKSGILGFGIRNPAQGIRNLSSTCEESRARNSQSGIGNPGLLWISSAERECGFRNAGNFCLWNKETGKVSFSNPESWALEPRIKRQKSGIPLTIEIRTPIFTDKESGIQSPESMARNLESKSAAWI